LRPNLNIKVVQIGQRNLYGNFLASKKAPPKIGDPVMPMPKAGLAVPQSPYV